MLLLPFENKHIQVNYSAEEAILRIQELLRDRSSFLEKLHGYADNTPDYVGAVFNNQFELTRKIYYRNSFIPQVKGVITPSNNGCTVNIKMKLHPVVLIFWIIWMGGVSLFTIFTGFLSTIMLSNGFNFTKHGLTMLLGGYLIILLPFKYESYRAKKDIKKALQ